MNKLYRNIFKVLCTSTTLLLVVCCSKENISIVKESANNESITLPIKSSKQESAIDNCVLQGHEAKNKELIDYMSATNTYSTNDEKDHSNFDYTSSPTTVTDSVTWKPPAYNISPEINSAFTSTSSSTRKVLIYMKAANNFTTKSENENADVPSKLNKTTDTNTSTNKNKIHIAKCCPHGKIVLNTKNEITHEKTYNCDKSNKIPPNNFPVHTIAESNQIKITKKYFEDVFELVDSEVPTNMFQENFQNFGLLAKKKGLNCYMLENGTLLISINGTPEWKYYETDKYCADLLNNGKKNKKGNILRFFIYHGELVDQTKNILKISMMLVSCLFLVLVLVVYGLLPELQNLRGLVIMSYVGSLLTTFVLLSTVYIIYLVNKIDQNKLKIFVFSTYFFTLSSFLWMNILSYDTWHTSRGFSIFYNSRRSRRRDRYRLYCAYAWGVPLLVTVLVSHFDDILVKNSWFRPDIAEYNFFSPHSTIIYVALPMSMVLLTNSIFFVLTFLNLRKLSRGNSTHLRNAVPAGQSSPAMISQWNRFTLHAKLFIAMGLTWVTEIFGQLYPDASILSYSMDLCNIFQGTYIFFMFVYKKKTWKMLVKRFTNAPTISKWYISSYTHQDV